MLVANGFSEGGQSGYTWTIATRIADAMSMAEQRFGPRDTAWFFAGFEFSVDGPQVWYPKNSTLVVMQLSMGAQGDFCCAIHELAHEVVHLLAPTGGRSANNFEEGVATLFSAEYSVPVTGVPPAAPIPSYERARIAVKQLVDQDPNLIRKLRSMRPRFVDFTADFLKDAIPSVDPAMADFLCAKFVR